MSIKPSPLYQRFLRVVDNAMEEAEENLQENGGSFSCGKGCSHCCHMLVETTWDEAIELATWVRAQTNEIQIRLRDKISEAAQERVSFFNKRPSTKRYRIPTVSGKEVPDHITEKYFHQKSRPCPILGADGACGAYEFRPSACRLHVVSSPPELCARNNQSEESAEIPDEVDEMRDRFEAAAEVALPDSRWGELSIMLQHAIAFLDEQEFGTSHSRSEDEANGTSFPQLVNP